MNLDTFRAERDATLADLTAVLLPDVETALADPDLRDMLTLVAADAADRAGASHQAAFVEAVAPALDATTADSDPLTVATWLATAATGYATATDPASDDLEWVTMRDDSVRPGHRDAHGQRRTAGDPFDVMGEALLFPGQPVGDPEVWLNCRCVLHAVPAGAAALFAAADGSDPTEEYVMTDPAPTDDDTLPEWDDEENVPEQMTWHGVLAPEDSWSGDGRRFAADAMTWRNLPLPLSWQKTSAMGHDGSVVIGQISDITRDGPLLRATGTFASTPEADEVIGLLAEGHVRGVSVDVDDAEMTMEDDESDRVTLTRGRICGATVCAIPAFHEAFIALGPADGGTDEFRDVPPDERKRLADKGEAMPDGSFPIANVDDLRNAIQAIGRAKDPAAAKAHIKKRARALNHPELIPDGWTADTDPFKRGPGWITDPIPTRRIHDYWTRGKGAAKIRWGVPGDFDRCRTQLAKYIGPVYLNRTCALWHHDALGIWPGQETGKRGAHTATTDDCDDCTESVVLTAALDVPLPGDWFTDPALPGPTPLTLDGDHVFGHLALWGTCHLGFGEKACVTAPRSASGYAYFATGQVSTTDGPVPVGQITMNTGHASLADDARGAAYHYDHTGAAVADVCMGEDDHGIWFTGALRPGLTDDQRRTVAAAALSGDWRGVRGNLELVAALAVNVPGFPVPRTSLAASAGRQTALVAAGITPAAPDQADAIATRVVEIMDERADRKVRAQRVAATARTLRVQVLEDALRR